MRKTLPANLITIKELASFLSVSEITVRRRIASGEIPVHRIGHGPKANIRINPVDVAEYLKSTRGGEV